jgi:hypothetical protein
VGKGAQRRAHAVEPDGFASLSSPTASAMAAKFGFLRLVPVSRNPDDFCSIPMKPSALLLNATTFTGRPSCTRLRKSPISMVKPPSPESEITWRRRNVIWAPIACGIALAMEPCQNDPIRLRLPFLAR